MTTTDPALTILGFAHLCARPGETAPEVARRAAWLDEHGGATRAGLDLAAALASQRGTRSIFAGHA